MKRFLLLTLCVLGAAPLAYAQAPAAAPVGSYIFPAGGQRGTTVQVRVGGEQLPPACDFFLQGEGVSAPQRVGGRPAKRYLEPAPYKFPTMDSTGYPKEWSQQITMAPDAPLGAVYWRLGTAQGGTSARLFVIGDLPEMIETEPNSLPARAEPVKLPITINGQFDPREDVDRYRFHAEKGQQIVCEVAAQRIGSVADAVLEVRGPDGKTLAVSAGTASPPLAPPSQGGEAAGARSRGGVGGGGPSQGGENGAARSQGGSRGTLSPKGGEGLVVDDSEGGDPRVVFMAPETGEYRVAVWDVGYEGGPEYVYRLTVEARPHVRYVFPAGGQRGTSVEVELYGSGLRSGEAGVVGRAHPTGDEAGEVGGAHPTARRQSVRQGVALSADSMRQTQEVRYEGAGGVSNAVPLVLGDLREIVVEEWEGTGETPVPPTTEQGIGGRPVPPDTEQGAGETSGPPDQNTGRTPVPPATDQDTGGTPVPQVRLPVTINGRLETVGDVDEYAFAGKQGERVAISCNTRRIRTPVVPAIELRSAAGQVLGQANGLEAAQGEVGFEAVLPADGEYRLSIRDMYGTTRGGPNFIYRLTIRPAEADFALALARDYVDVGPGGKAQLDLAVTRRGGFDGAVSLKVEGLPAGVTFEPAAVAGNQNQVKLTLTAAADALVRSTPIRVVGEATIRERAVGHAATAPYAGAPGGAAAGASVAEPRIDTLLLTVTHPPVFSLESDDTFRYRNKGATHPARIKVERKEGYRGEITIRIADRQIRELDGFSAAEVVAGPDQTEVIFPVRLLETMELNRPSSRVYVLGTGPVTLPDGKVVYLLAVSPKQIVIKNLPAMLELSAGMEELEVARGESVEVAVEVRRTLDFPQPVEVTLAASDQIRGVTVEPVSVAAGQTRAAVRVHFAEDADLGHEGQIRLRAVGMREGYAVESEAAMRVYWKER